MHTALESTRVRLIAVVVVAVSLMSCSLGVGGPEATLGPTPLQPTPLFRRVVVAAVAPLRTGPGPDFESVGQLVRGDVVAVLGTSPNSQWYRVIAPDIAAEPAEAWLLTELTAEIGAAPGGAGRQRPTPSQASEVVTPSQGGGHNELTPAPTGPPTQTPAATSTSLPTGVQPTKPPGQTAAAVASAVPAATETKVSLPGPTATASTAPQTTVAPPTATHTATPLPVPSSTDTVTAAPTPSDTPTATLMPPEPPTDTPHPVTAVPPPAGTPDPLPSLVPLPTFVFPFPTFVWP